MNESTPTSSDETRRDDAQAPAPRSDHQNESEPHEERETRTVTEEFKVSGEAVIGKVKELVREGNVRRIVVANEEGRTLLEIPLTIGVIGTVLLPVWAAIGAVAALAANLTLKVERRVPVDPDESDGPEPGTESGTESGTEPETAAGTDRGA